MEVRTDVSTTNLYNRGIGETSYTEEENKVLRASRPCQLQEGAKRQQRFW